MSECCAVMTPLGVPVEPEVKMMYSGSSSLARARQPASSAASSLPASRSSAMRIVPEKSSVFALS